MVRDPPAHSESREAGRGQNSVRAISRIHRQNSEFKFPQKIWSARSAVCSAFPPQNPDSARIRHAPRGSKSTVRSKILKFEPTFFEFPKNFFENSLICQFHIVYTGFYESISKFEPIMR